MNHSENLTSTKMVSSSRSLVSVKGKEGAHRRLSATVSKIPHILRFAWVFLGLLVFFGGCQDVEFPGLKCQLKSVDGPVDDVVGKWRLVRVKTYNMENGKSGEIDYSCEHIVYQFFEDGTVEISGGDFEYVRDSGTYGYELTLTPFNSPNGYTIEIGSRSWACFIEPASMTLDASGLDGEILEFVRIG